MLTNNSINLVLGALAVIFAAAGAQRVPETLQPPANEQLVVQVHAKGEQIYSCKVDGAQAGWTLKASDGSRVVAKAAANVASPDADSIPWLLVKVVSHEGEGVLARVTSIQRINTKAGKAPVSGCDAAHAGQEVRVPYSADYVFFAPK